jgi:hypothetical protein
LSNTCALDGQTDTGILIPAGEGRVEFDPKLAESALFAVIRGSRQELAYHAAREDCYKETDLELRDRTFTRLDLEWFERLDIARPVLRAYAEWPDISSGVGRCIVVPGYRPQDECAELYVRSEPSMTRGNKPNLLIRLSPESFRNPEHIQIFLRHELTHISDMMDPVFLYDPAIEQFYDDTGIPNAIRDRYKVLWDSYIDGRVCRGNLAPPALRKRRLHEFKALFRVLGDRTMDAFDSIFDARKLTHPEMMDIARTPLRLLERLDTV